MMDWVLTSTTVALLLVVAPLLIAEVTARSLVTPHLSRQRRRLWLTTAGTAVAVLAWLIADRAAIGNGNRSMVVTTVAAGAFALLFGLFAWPVIRAADDAVLENTDALREIAPGLVPAIGARFDYVVAVVALISGVAFILSPNDLGYRLKGALTVAVGVVLYALCRPRAQWTFIAFATSAWLTLFLNWQQPWQRRLGLGGQFFVGIIGFIWCARLLRGVPQPRALRSGACLR